LGGPKADRLLWAIETLKRTFAPTLRRGSYRANPVIQRAQRAEECIAPKQNDVCLCVQFDYNLIEN
jgi:hypothetical protein